MKAIGFKQSLPITERDSFIEFETDIPQPGERDVLVKIKAISVNPVDYKIRQSAAKDKTLEQPKVIGWDASGTVVATGSAVTLFKEGDEVFYAGDLTRSGCNAEYQVVDERIVGRKARTLNYAEAAAMPLTTLTAWELLKDRMHISKGPSSGKTILMIGGAGGVGSIAIQLAKQIFGLTVVATASRPETKEWCEQMGADVVVDHKDLVTSARRAGFQYFDYIADYADANGYWDAMAELIAPGGHIASITGSGVPVLLNKLKTKSASFSWEFMFTRSMYQTEDMVEQHKILNELALLLERGILKTTLHKTINGFSAENLKAAHQLQESGKSIGKTVIAFE